MAACVPTSGTSTFREGGDGETTSGEPEPEALQSSTPVYTQRRTMGVVAESSAVLDGPQDDHARLELAELAEHVRAKLNLAIQLACEAEHERRSCHWESAKAYQRQWEEVMAEVKHLLPLMRKSGVSLFPTGKGNTRQKRR